MNSQLTVYKASAGSGKTFTLAKEYMTLVIENPMAYRTRLPIRLRTVQKLVNCLKLKNKIKFKAIYEFTINCI